MANCLLERSGKVTYPCSGEERDFTECTKGMDSDAWSSYSTFFTHVCKYKSSLFRCSKTIISDFLTKIKLTLNLCLTCIEQSCFYFASLEWQEKTSSLISGLEHSSEVLHQDLQFNIQQTNKIGETASDILSKTQATLDIS